MKPSHTQPVGLAQVQDFPFTRVMGKVENADTIISNIRICII
jgi:hypothetical protein